MSRALEKFKFKNKTSLNTSQEVANCLNASELYKREQNIEETGKVGESLAIVFNHDQIETEVTRSKRIITNLTSYYNLQSNENDEIYSTIYSDLEARVAVSSSVKTTSQYFRTQVENLNAQETHQIDSSSPEQLQRNMSLIRNNITSKRISIKNIFDRNKSEFLLKSSFLIDFNEIMYFVIFKLS